MPQSGMNEKVSASLVLLLLIGSSSFVIAQQTPSAGSLKSGEVENLSSKAIYEELKARGIDPLSPSTPAKLRQAFVTYDFETGSGLNLETSASSKSAKQLNEGLQSTTLVSQVQVSTKFPGARIKYHLIGVETVTAIPQLTNNAKDTLPIGLYWFWSERAGNSTSKPVPIRVIRPVVAIDIEETSQ
jgi:hypothetical protein